MRRKFSRTAQGSKDDLQAFVELKVSDASVEREQPKQPELVQSSNFLGYSSRVTAFVHSPKIMTRTHDNRVESDFPEEMSTSLYGGRSFKIYDHKSFSGHSSQKSDSAKKLISELYEADYIQYKRQIRMTVDQSNHIATQYNALVEKKLMEASASVGRQSIDQKFLRDSTHVKQGVSGKRRIVLESQDARSDSVLQDRDIVQIAFDGKLSLQYPSRSSSISSVNKTKSSARFYSNPKVLPKLKGTNSEIHLDKAVKFAIPQQFIKKLFKAKCQDLQIQSHQDQADRFFQYCHKALQDNKIKFNEQGLGPNSAFVLGKIINQRHFSSLDLAKNSLGNEGLYNLLEGVELNRSLVSLDLGSNDIMLDGAARLFDVVREHPTISALTVANYDRINRNRIGLKACKNLANMLRDNPILSFLNIADNRIGNEGLSIVSTSLTPKSPLVVLNLSRNDLDGDQPILLLACILRGSKNLLELNLSHNKIGDNGISELAGIFSQNQVRLQKLLLVNTNLTVKSSEKLFEALSHNRRVKELDLSENDLSGWDMPKLQHFLYMNVEVRTLNLAKCCLGQEGVKSIGLGLYKNRSLQALNLSGNRLPKNSMSEWSSIDCQGLFGLKQLDLQDNPLLGDQSVVWLLSGLKNKINSDSGEVIQPKLQMLNLKNTDIKNRTVDFLCRILACNTTLQKCEITHNFVKPHLLEQVRLACARNQQFKESQRLPECQQELHNLMSRGLDCSRDQRKHFRSVFDRMREERSALMKGIDERETILEHLRIETAELRKRQELLRQKTEKRLSDLDQELQKTDAKICECHQENEGLISANELNLAIVRHKQEGLRQQIAQGESDIQKSKAIWQSKISEMSQKLDSANEKAQRQLDMQQQLRYQIRQARSKLSQQKQVEPVLLDAEDKENAKPQSKQRNGSLVKLGKRIGGGGFKKVKKI